MTSSNAKNQCGAKLTNVRFKPKIKGLVSKKDILAEYLSCGFEVKDAAKRMGIDYTYAHAIMQRIRKDLGKQAA